MFSQTASLTATCARCGAARDVPAADRPRWPAADPKGSVTVSVDLACSCGSRRIRLTVQLK